MFLIGFMTLLMVKIVSDCVFLGLSVYFHIVCSFVCLYNL